MMYCTYCGKEINDGSKFCSHCGNPVVEIVGEKPKTDVKGKVFAYIGLGLGIESLIISLIPYLCFWSFMSSIPGFILSNKGINSSKCHYALKGRKMNKLAIIFGSIMTVLTFVILAILLS